MLHQLISRTGGNADEALRDVPKDPRNQQAVNILFLAVCPLGLQIGTGKPAAWMAGMALVAALFAAALWLISKGLANAKAFDGATAAAPPRLPLKLAGSALIGVAVLVLGVMRAGEWGDIAFYAALCAGLSVLAFGIDPLRAKGLDTAADRQKHRAEAATRTADARMSEMCCRIAALKDPELDARICDFAAALNRLLGAVRGDPERLRVLRRHLGIYLDGALAATERFAALHATAPDAGARSDYMDLLFDLAAEFDEQAIRYARGGKDRLDIEIGVLRDRIGKPAGPSPRS